MGTYRFCNENVRFKIFDKNKYYNAEPAQYILSIGFRPEDTTSEQLLNCIRNLIDIGIIAKEMHPVNSEEVSLYCPLFSALKKPI